jgi:hypothetical protein
MPLYLLKEFKPWCWFTYSSSHTHTALKHKAHYSIPLQNSLNTRFANVKVENFSEHLSQNITKHFQRLSKNILSFIQQTQPALYTRSNLDCN